MILLSLENITSGYGKKEVIKNISFEIQKAEIVTLIGSNGAGKSTVLKTIYGLNKIWNDGKIYFNGEDISNAKAEELLKKGIVYIGQKDNTFDTLTIIENLKIAGYIYDNKVLNHKIEQVFKLFPKLKQMQTKKPSELSGGEKQILALAMGLIHEPRLILFDEPSAGLDVKNMKEVFGIIMRLNVDTKVSFLIVEHRVKEIMNITDRFVALRLGEKVYDNVSVDEYSLKEIFL